MLYISNGIWKILTCIPNEYQSIIFTENKFKLTISFGNGVQVSDLDWGCRFEGISIYIIGMMRINDIKSMIILRQLNI